MKKIIIISILLTTFTPNIFAQSKLDVYAAGSFGLSKVKNAPNYGGVSSNFSGSIGSHLIYKLKPNIDLVAMPVLQQRGYKISNSAFSYDVRVNYIDIPIGIQFGLGFGPGSIVKYEKGEKKPLFIGVGVYASIATNGRYIDKYAIVGNPSTKIKFGESLTDNRSRTDYGLMITAGGQLGRGRIGFFKQIGLKNVIPNARQAKEGSIKTTNFGFFVAYKLNKNKNKNN